MTKRGSLEWKKAISLAKKGKKRIPYSIDARATFRKKKLGSNNPSWKGGIFTSRMPLVEIIRRCFKYRQWRDKVFKRDNFICVTCGYNKGAILEADHIERLADLMNKYSITTLEQALECEELWNIKNGRTLCQPCHKKTDTWGHKIKY